MIACLPMYDWPEVRAETDGLWTCLRDALGQAGFDAPEALTRVDDPWPAWRDPALVLGQTCGLPYAARLAGQVSLLGAPDYGLEGASPGAYYSEIIVRADSDFTNFAALKGARFGFNERRSQSGWAALDAICPIEAHFGEAVETGGHRFSVAAVAEGRVDCAAIDAVSWALARRHEPAATGVRVIARTPPTPGLPFITARRPAEEAQRMAVAVDEAMAALPPAISDGLFLRGFRHWRPEDYAPLAAGWPEAA